MGREAAIFQVTGFQNSGKTTLIQKLLERGQKQGLKLATIKHHGHGGSPDTSLPKKDTAKHIEAGAFISAVEGDGDLLLSISKSSWPLERILEFYAFFQFDLILIEGYKKAEFPKVVLIKEKEEEAALLSLVNIKAVISWYPIEQSLPFPVFLIKEEEAFIEWFFKKIPL